ncbi:DUF3987 domain-containing protein [Streptomyces smyrnaeus]|uniref:DUF3987 domain-containing protein n=1 Tax=Streptomyces smyrnaeus TaxID=1387713 RepID=UPI0036CA2283
MNSERPIPAPIVYNGLLGEIVKTLEPGTEADPVGVLGSIMTGFSAYIGNKAHLRLGYDRHPILVWAILIGRTSKGKKGSATGAAMYALNMLDKQFYDNETVRGLASGEALVRAVADPSYDEQQEALEAGEELEVGGRMAFVIDPEYGMTMLRSSGGSTLSGHLRNAWDGGNLVNATKKETLKATTPHVAVLGHITPREFRSRMSDRELSGGTYNRYLILHVHQSKLLPPTVKTDEKKLRRLVDKLRVNAEKARQVEEMSFAAEAEKYWNEYLRPQIQEEDPEDEVLEQFTARRDPYTLRLAALYALADGRDVIERDDLNAAHAVYTYSMKSIEFTLQEAAPRLDGVTRRGKSEEWQEALRSALIAAGDEGLPRKELARVVGNNVSASHLDQLLASLPVATKPGRSTGRGGRPPVVTYWVGNDQGDGYV